MDKDKLLHYNFSTEKSKDNNEILIINGKYIHSKFTPLKEADDFIFKEKNLIVIFGIGFAYHVNNILKNNPGSYFIIYEPYQDIFDLAVKYINKELLKKNSNRVCILKDINTDVIYNFIKKNFRPEMRIRTYSNLGYKNLFFKCEIEYLNAVKKNFETVVQNILTESNFIPLWTKNFLLNIKHLNDKPLLNPGKNELDNNLAVIACAGPSLLDDLEIIKKNRDKITIFTVDTALKVLTEYNIVSDFIISLDAQYYSINDYIKNIPDESTLILDAVSYSNICRGHKNIYYTITENIFDGSIIRYFFEYNKIDKFGLITGGNVSDYAAALAISLGFKNIYFSGLDLSYVSFQTHSKFSPFYFRAMFFSDYYNSMDLVFIKTIANRNLKSIDSKVEGKKVYTDFVLQNYAFYFNNFAEFYNEIKIYNSKFDGMKINNFINIDLQVLLEKNKSVRLKYNDLVNEKNLLYVSKEKLNIFFNDIISSIHKRVVDLNDLFSQTDFNHDNINKFNKWKTLINDVFLEFPFLKKFVLMTIIILQKKNITEEHLLYYKHIGHKTIQSIYFVIRTLQKILKQIN